MLLSAALITRDEERFLDACLRSLRGVVDEVVVVDTGSVDATVEVATRHGARVSTRPWTDDFAAARNVALDAARGRWILYIDADERLVDAQGLRPALGALAGDSRVVAGQVAFRPTRSSTCYLEHRVLANRPDLRFRGAIHETLLPDLHRLEAEGGRVVPVPAGIEHWGYEGDLTAKARRDLPMLERQVVADPGRTFLWYQLGRVHNQLGRPEAAERAWSRGAAVALATGRLRPDDLPLVAELVLHRLNQAVGNLPDGTISAAADAAPDIDQAGEVDELVKMMRDQHPDDPFTLWAHANQAMAARRWPEAVAVLDRLVEHPAADGVDPILAYDQHVFASWSHHALGVCWLQLGDPDRAVRALRLAVAGEPERVEYRVKLDLAEARARA